MQGGPRSIVKLGDRCIAVDAIDPAGAGDLSPANAALDHEPTTVEVVGTAAVAAAPGPRRVIIG